MLELNLNNLTAEHLAAAEPNCGKACTYAGPCIIGTLIPTNQRARLDEYDDSTITALVDYEEVKFPDSQQYEDATEMQAAFDVGNWARVEELAEPYLS